MLVVGYWLFCAVEEIVVSKLICICIVYLFCFKLNRFCFCLVHQYPFSVNLCDILPLNYVTTNLGLSLIWERRLVRRVYRRRPPPGRGCGGGIDQWAWRSTPPIPHLLLLSFNSLSTFLGHHFSPQYFQQLSLLLILTGAHTLHPGHLLCSSRMLESHMPPFNPALLHLTTSVASFFLFPCAPSTDRKSFSLLRQDNLSLQFIH